MDGAKRQATEVVEHTRPVRCPRVALAHSGVWLEGVRRDLLSPWCGQAGRSRLGRPCVAGCDALGFLVFVYKALHPMKELLCCEDEGCMLACA